MDVFPLFSNCMNRTYGSAHILVDENKIYFEGEITIKKMKFR